MSDWASFDSPRYNAIGTIEYFNSRGTFIRSGSTIHTKGSYAQLTPATPFDASFIRVSVSQADVVSQALVDIAIGPRDQETVILSNLMADATTASLKSYSYPFPISIPKNTRIAARVQSSSTSASYGVVGQIRSGGFADRSPAAAVKTYGATTASSAGTSLDPGGTANVKGAWTQLTATTTAPLTQIRVGFCGQTNDIRTDADWLVDVGIGAAGSEQVIIPNIPLFCIGSGDVLSPLLAGPFTFPIPRGSRIAVRAQCSITDATDRLIDVAIYGIS